MPDYTVDSDGDVEMSLPQPILEVIRAPELSSWNHAALIEWLREWERYVQKMRRRCTTTGETYENVVATVKGCVERKTLKNMATYVLKKLVVDVTDVDIMGAVKARCRTLKNEFVPDVTSLFRHKLKMDLSIDDCDARVFGYYEDFNAEGRLGVTYLVENLQPPVLKAQLTRLIDLEMRDCKSYDVVLFDLILEHAKVQQRFHRKSHDYAARGDSKAAEPDRKSQKTSDASAKAEPARSTPSAAQPHASARAPRPSRPPPQDGSLVCKGAHWLKDCPTATDAQKEAARTRYQAEKEQRTQAFRSKAARTGTTRNIVRVKGLLEVPYIADTSADQSVVSSAIVESLRAVQPDLRTNSLSSAISVTLADGRSEWCGMEVVLDFELVTIAGRVSLRSVPCLILEGDGDEFLLDKDALQRLGIDVDQALAQLADFTFLADDDDEFPVGAELPDQESTLITTLDQLLERAVANGLPQERVIAVRELLELFPDIWRAGVSVGRAANVKALRVTLCVDAKPYRSPPRKYAPLQAEFIREYVRSLVADGLVEKNNAARWASLFELEILWCGRLFSADGVRHDPTRVDALSTLPLSATAADPQRLIFATNWLHDSLPDYTSVIAPLHDKLEAEKKRIGRRNRNALQVTITWAQEERSCYERVLSLLKDSALMVHPDPDAELCVFADASLFGFSIVTTQVVNWQQGVPVEKQDHQLVICQGRNAQALTA
ncbi:unnamed protein product [Phytophthora fragariaefolia]|uniref:Unnamed protein product n=1 Tax=Phytophthora fragariaefolia TaxID=1490495 RepID=A0A9W6XCS0_9STRA|nr:unnamed protein product [Phytophthora fragariaefolia]